MDANKITRVTYMKNSVHSSLMPGIFTTLDHVRHASHRSPPGQHFLVKQLADDSTVHTRGSLNSVTVWVNPVTKSYQPLK